MSDDRQPRFDRVPDLDRYVSEGMPVEVLNSDSEETNATLIEVSPTRVSELPVNWRDDIDRLYEFWSGFPEVNPDDRVVRVEIGNSEYAYPSSRVKFQSVIHAHGIGRSRARTLRLRGVENWIDLMETPKEELLRLDGVGKQTAEKIKKDVGHVRPTEDATCPVDGCLGSPDEEELYDHMISEHGWYSDDLEVKKAK